MPCTVELACIDPSLMPNAWPLARDFIKRAIEKTGLSDFATVEADVLAGRQLVWLAVVNKSAVEAAATTELVKVGQRKICNIVACAGANRRRWLPLIAEIEAYAKAEGCDAMRIGGRKGWARVLSGYRAQHVIMDKELS